MGSFTVYPTCSGTSIYQNVVLDLDGLAWPPRGAGILPVCLLALHTYLIEMGVTLEHLGKASWHIFPLSFHPSSLL